MEPDYNNRIKDIQRRKEERERDTRKKQIAAVRCAAAVVLAGLIFLLVFGIKSCVNAVSERRAQRAASEAVTDEATAEPEAARDPKSISTEGNVDNGFYKNSAFIGNSFVDGMEMYELVNGADYFARIGLNVKDAMTLSTSTGSVAVIDELGGGKRYDKIFMMFGENELGWNSADSFKEQYKTIIEKVKEYQSGADIYLLAITPITEKVSELAEDGATKDNILMFNQKILEAAKEENVNFADIYTPLADDKGYLPESAASDGIHFTESYYKKCLVYIQNAFAD